MPSQPTRQRLAEAYATKCRAMRGEGDDVRAINLKNALLGCLTALLCAVGCASSRFAEGPLSAGDLERWSVHILTWDADGDRRTTRVWIAAVGGTPYLRTTQTKWWQNIARGSKTRILSGDRVYPVSIEEIRDPSLRAKIDAAFAAKYGWLGKLVIDDERAQGDDPYMQLIPVTEDPGSDR